MRIVNRIQSKWSSAPSGLRLFLALVLAMTMTFNVTQGLNAALQHNAVANLTEAAAETVDDPSGATQDDYGLDGAMHVHAHCACHVTYAANAAQAQPEAPTAATRLSGMTAATFASRAPPPLPEPPRA